MNKFIAYSGLNCEICNVKITPINNDDDLRVKVAENWDKFNIVEITKEMINCISSRMDGVKIPFCDNMCEIRKCARSKKIKTYGDYENSMNCENVKMIIGNNERFFNE